MIFWLLLSAHSCFAFDKSPVTVGQIMEKEVKINASFQKDKEADWTFMWFINGKNDLEQYAMIDINELESSGSDSKVNIVAEMGRINGQDGDDNSDGNWVGVKRYFIVKDADRNKINSPVLADLGKKDMGSWKELADFIVWSKKNYPAKKYALIMWDHGNGWKPVDENNWQNFYKGFSLDEETGNEISVPQMAKALSKAGGVDFILLDGCNMAMASVIYELKDYAKVAAASQETEPGMVVRYSSVLAEVKKGELSPEDLGFYFVYYYRAYFEQMSGDNEGAAATQSAFRLYKASEFSSVLDRWVSVALKSDISVLSKAKKEAKFFGEDPDYKDLSDFVSLVYKQTQSQELKKVSIELDNFLKKDFIIYNWAQDSKSAGLSVYIPSEKYREEYSGLKFSKNGLWDE
ncbi:MAG: hypothetical protein GX447_04380, partial [Elusimicrobia bacterium]|nr:hypothetical protein [Elusimicrobiota bacterium]